MRLHLGIIIDETGSAINHRSLLKVALNPILRRFGLYIGTKYNPATKELGTPAFGKCRCSGKIKWEKYDLPKNSTVIKKRIWI